MCSVNKVDMFVCLPESGADPTIESDSGFNAMDMAVAMGHRNGTCKSNTQSESTFKAKNHVGTLKLKWMFILCEYQ